MPGHAHGLAVGAVDRQFLGGFQRQEENGILSTLFSLRLSPIYSIFEELYRCNWEWNSAYVRGNQKNRL